VPVAWLLRRRFFFHSIFSSCTAPTFTVQLGAQNTLLTTPQRAAFGQQYGPPDGSLGVYLNSGTNIFFGAARRASTKLLRHAARAGNLSPGLHVHGTRSIP
jgi:hypothetical protein